MELLRESEPRKSPFKSVGPSPGETYLRLSMRAKAQDLTYSRGMRKCGKGLAFQQGGGTVCLCLSNDGSGRTFFSGLLRCSSVWECPVCAPKVQAGRADELLLLNAAHRAAGGGCYMVTLTLPHDVGDDLKPLRKHVAKAWQSMQAGKSWKEWKQRLGILGTVRALEITHGVAGWHPHLHVAVYTSRSLSQADADTFERWLFERWRDRITRRTPEGIVYRAPVWEVTDPSTGKQHKVGVRLEPLRATRYLQKMGLAKELVSSWTKEGRHGHRTAFQILRDMTLGRGSEAQQRRDVALWDEWARGMKGARQLTYSRGLFAHYGLRAAATDDDLPDQPDLEGLSAKDSTIVHVFKLADWLAVVRSPASVRLRVQFLQLPQLVPRASWAEAVMVLLDEAHGLEPVPF